jgi:ABC-type multidrug transport system ATPase subunit
MSDPEQTALDFLWGTAPAEPVGFVRSQLGRVLFSGDDVKKSLSSLSGGEAARLLFARLAIEKPNVLLLDEPTNHLDFEAIEALAGTLTGYEGTLLLVSHNRWFVSRLCTRIIEVTHEGLREYPGGYGEYTARFGVDHLDREAVAKTSREQSRDQRRGKELPQPVETGVNWEEQKRLRNRKKQLPKLRADNEAAIARAELRQKQIQADYAEPGFFDTKSPSELQALRMEERALATRLTELLAEWETLERETTQLEAL